MIELLVAILVVGALIAMIVAIGGRAMAQQKIALTRSVLNNATLAADVFATENPLRSIYDRRDQATFGPYPPYQLANADRALLYSVQGALEPNYLLGNKNTLAERLARDLSGQTDPVLTEWVQLAGPDQNDDNRAFYAYLRAFTPAALGNLGDDVLKPLGKTLELINPAGAGMAPSESLADVLGLHDGWGVPIDYFLMVDLRVGVDDSGAAANAVYKVVDRRPVFRSRGIPREVYDLEQTDITRSGDRSKWIFSAELPRPYAAVGADGSLPTPPTSDPARQQVEGWARLVADGDDYEYLP